MCFRPASVDIPMNCPKCGAQMSATAQTCPSCGASESAIAEAGGVFGGSPPVRPGAPGMPKPAGAHGNKKPSNAPKPFDA